MTPMSLRSFLLFNLLLWAFGALIFSESVSIHVGVNKNMDATVFYPAAQAPVPAMLLLHTSGGLQQADLDFAKRLSGEGYVVLVPAFLSAYNIESSNRQLTFTIDANNIYADFVECIAELRQNKRVDAGKIGAIGFSNGGYFALWLAATGKIKAGISYYGALSGAGTDKLQEKFRVIFSASSAPVLILHGDSDSTVPINNAILLDSILTASGAPHQFYQFAGAYHRFDRDGGSANEAAATKAWQLTLSFLKTVFN
jgi:carboxymethylenebutenolidase